MTASAPPPPPPPPPPPARLRERHHSGQHAMGAVGPDPSELMNLPPPSPHSRIRRRRARKAIRRTKTTLDSRPLRKQLSDLDPREPQESSKPGSRLRTRQFSLPEGNDPPAHPIDPDMFITSRTNHDSGDQNQHGGYNGPGPCPPAPTLPRLESPRGTPPLETSIDIPAEVVPQLQLVPPDSSSPPDLGEVFSQSKPPIGRSSGRRQLKRTENVEVLEEGPSQTQEEKDQGLEEVDGAVCVEVTPTEAVCVAHPPPVTTSTPQKQSPSPSVPDSPVVTVPTSPHRSPGELFPPEDMEDSLSCSPNITIDSCSTHMSDLSSSLTTPSSTLTPATSRSVTPSAFFTPESSRPSSTTTDSTSDFSTSYSDDSPFNFRLVDKKSAIPELDEKSESSSTLTEQTNNINTQGDSNDSNGNSDKSRPKSINFFKLPGFLRKSSEDKVGSLPTSQQSSVVGLDWLFSTDSDSLSSRE